MKRDAAKERTYINHSAERSGYRNGLLRAAKILGILACEPATPMRQIRAIVRLLREEADAS